MGCLLTLLSLFGALVVVLFCGILLIPIIAVFKFLDFLDHRDDI